MGFFARLVIVLIAGWLAGLDMVATESWPTFSLGSWAVFSEDGSLASLESGAAAE